MQINFKCLSRIVFFIPNRIIENSVVNYYDIWKTLEQRKSYHKEKW